MRGYRLAPLVWASGLALGLATAYTRIAADRHYFTDTVVGSAFGAGVPYFAHRPIGRGGARLSATPIDRGAMVGVFGTF